MPEAKRVRDDKTGAEYSTYGWQYDGLTVLDKEPAVDERTGELLPPKYPEKTPAPAKSQAATTQARKASTEEH